MTNYFLPVPSTNKKSSVTADEARAIWLSAKQKHVELLIKTLWYTGLRITEALTLTAGCLIPDGFDFVLNVTREKQVRNKSRRKKKVVLPVLTERLPIARELGLDMKEYIKDNSIGVEQRLFPGHRTTYWRQIQKCARIAGIPNCQDIHPHSFRHGFIYDKANKGIHPYVLSRLAGHKSLRTTMEYYQPTENDLRQAMEK